MDLNARPANLSPQGDKAYDTILAFLRQKGALETGGCKSFYSPEEWKARGEQYGRDSLLIVVYDGGDLPPYFSLDHSAPTYKRFEEMTAALEAAGFWWEECTGWYSAIYGK